MFSFCLHSPPPQYLALCLVHGRGLVKVSQLNQRQDNLILEGKGEVTCKGTETKCPIGKILGKYHLAGLPGVGGSGGWGCRKAVHSLFNCILFFLKSSLQPHLLCFLSLMVLWELNQLTKGPWKMSFPLTPLPSHRQLLLTEARTSSGLSQFINFCF